MAAETPERLIDVMAEAERHFDATVERRLVTALAAAELLVPVIEGEEGGYQVRAQHDARGGVVLMGFTDADAFAAWADGHEVAYVTMSGRELAGWAAPADAVALQVNAAGPHGGRLERRFVDVVAAGGALAFDARQNAEGDLALHTTGGALALRPFAQAPDPQLIEALGATVDKLPEVEEAWLVEMTDPGPPHPLLVLVGPADVPPALRDVLHQLLTPDRFVDTMPIAPDAWAGDRYAAVRTAGVRLK